MTKLHYIGVYAGYPNKESTTTGFCLEVDKGSGALFLIDCPENTQCVLAQLGLALVKVQAIFITHMHMDHIAGLVPLIQTLFVQDKNSPLTLVGPAALQEYVKFNFAASCGPDISPYYKFVAAEDNLQLQMQYFVMNSRKLNHINLPTFGYLFEFPDFEEWNMKQLRLDGFPFGLEIQQLKKKQNVEIKGKIYNWQNYLNRKEKIRIAFCLDCVLDTYFKDFDYLITELSFIDMDEKATEYGHTCLNRLKQVIPQMNVKKVILSHFSQRWFKALIDKYEQTKVGNREISFLNEITIVDQQFNFGFPTVMALPKCFTKIE